MFKKAGTHPLVAQYNSLVDQLKEIERQLKAAEVAANKNRPRPIYKLVAAEPNRWPNDGSIRFYAELQNKAEFDALMHEFGGITNAPEQKLSSVAYYWMNGLLLHNHGGHLLFDSFDTPPPQISEEEWIQLSKFLIVPESIKNSKTYYILASGN